MKDESEENSSPASSSSDSSFILHPSEEGFPMPIPFDPQRFQASITRRTFLGRTAYGLGSLALASLLNPKLRAGEPTAADSRWQGVVNPPHFPVRARRV